ncbi:substrate-binding domain-containing protein [Amaricoccus solimangrovi]|uniref:Quinoprotein dehydrogenase-associated putative ABC transporter substrate-binding protein n=1 Tax=Amaricoccus solimangrovi TaxID=2589815 RepID=A0A501WRZ3_9RHOB|nr:substrate-binding domain-containing protein [Amaricoccus solimangrovi]TPE52138.1 quinoprotein dehydrogenase-associated putative ABC transporter substrate-binding protein [Amaricoccus solimangrovi]
MPAWASPAAALAAALLLIGGPLAAQPTDLVSRTAFRVCADPANAPESDKDGTGFENRIAELMAETLDRPLQYFWSPMAMGFVRRTLLGYNCDVIIGYAQGEDMVMTTNAYYTSAYALVAREDSDLADVTTLADPRLRGRRIGVIAGTPPASYLAHYGLLKTVRGYNLQVDRRVESPNEDMLRALEAGELDIAVMWGPVAGPLVKQSGAPLKLTPLVGEPKPQGAPRLFYRVSMGVRNGEDVWKRELNSTLRKVQPRIDEILREAGVPLLNDMGTALKPEVTQ